MKKLRLHLMQYKNTVEMRVLEQEGIDGPLSKNVVSRNFPVLQKDFIFLRGYDPIRDNDICCITFCTEQEASEYLEKVIGWLDDIFYPNGNKELKRGDEVLINLASNCKDMRYFLTDLGDDIVNGRYVTAASFNNGKYSNIGSWNEIIRIKKTGYDSKTDEYYGEII